MDWHVRAFLKASLAWLALGVTLGVAMAVHPAWTVHRPAHVHMVALGFVAMMIFGVAYHVIPRFSGHALHGGRRVATGHWWASNAGLALLVAGFAARGVGAPAATAILALGGVLSALGAYTFAYLIWRTIDGPAALRAGAARARAAADGVRSGGGRGATLPVASSGGPA